MHEHFLPLNVAMKLAVSLGVGLLAGLEREWSRKDLGVRTFALTALLGTLATLISLPFALGCLGAVALLILLVNARALLLQQNLEITTSVSLVVNFVLGVLIGMGHLFSPVAAALLLTLVLSSKSELSSFAGGLRPEEIRSAVLLGLIGFVIYPLLPDRFVDPWNLINPRESWITVVAIASIGFVNYVLLRLYGDRGLLYTAVLGGLVNSTATIAELASCFPDPASVSGRTATLFDFVTLLAMFLRNLALLAIFARQAVPSAAIPMILMSCTAALFVWASKGSASAITGDLKLVSPVSIRKMLSFGALFVVIEMAGALGTRYLGHYGVVIVSSPELSITQNRLVLSPRSIPIISDCILRIDLRFGLWSVVLVFIGAACLRWFEWLSVARLLHVATSSPLIPSPAGSWQVTLLGQATQDSHGSFRRTRARSRL
jgi:uncharacterized membrane protein (DUF4010 family)